MSTQKSNEEFEMKIERSSSHKYVVMFPQTGKLRVIIKEESSGYWSCSNDIGGHVYSNINLGHCFDHLYTREKEKWKKIHYL